MRLPIPRAVALVSALFLGACATAGGNAPPAVARAVNSSAGTIESTDARLEAALLAERLAPSAEAHLQIAREYARLGVLDFAHKRVERALMLAPRLAAAHEMMARVWRDWGHPGAGLVHVHRAIHYAPLSASGQNTLGTILDALGRVDEARAAYGRAFALDPSAGWALSNLCYLEFRQGRFTEARRQCDAALKATPGLREAHNNLALAYAASGDMAGARNSFLAAGDAAAALFNLGIVHLAAGHYEDAVRSFEAAIGARPDFTAAKSRAHEARMRALKAEDRKHP